MVRNAHRAMTSICSPFGEEGDFKTQLRVFPDKGWLSDLLDPKAVIEQALFTATGKIWGVKGEGEYVDYDYEFKPSRGMDRILGRRVTERAHKLEQRPRSRAG